MSELNPVNPVAMTVFIAFFLLVTVLGFVAARWKAGDLTHCTSGVWVAVNSARSFRGSW